ncbi:hypothetical protein JHK84_027440 [Glycine max]|uniref:Uncharacterized protein n=1 Tax=Glycine max TaxID=3847 RepID=K7LHX8_SOYBN|nr:hypothetical protein JHK85_027830 [Glycine max]KAG5150968.1 hypothetical protein JHK84_027440 [Glycine max]KAH1137207.1 hypothetical protein GYH30_027262 [Glycine max]
MYYLNQSPVGQVQFLVQSVRHLSFADVEKMKDLSFTKFHRCTKIYYLLLFNSSLQHSYIASMI